MSSSTAEGSSFSTGGRGLVVRATLRLKPGGVARELVDGVDYLDGCSMTCCMTSACSVALSALPGLGDGPRSAQAGNYTPAARSDGRGVVFSNMATLGVRATWPVPGLAAGSVLVGDSWFRATLLGVHLFLLRYGEVPLDARPGGRGED